MKLLSDLLYKVPIVEIIGSTNIAIMAVVADSRKIEKHCLFVAVKGSVVDGHNYIEQSIKDGAIAVVCEEFPSVQEEKVTYVKVRNSANSLGIIASNFYDNPSQQLKLVGITGTNGKTTSATLLYNLFKGLGHKVGLLSTVRNLIDREVVPSTHTTPDPVQLNRLLRRMVDSGCSHCFMEVSSHAVDQKRISGVEFSGAAFTNITHDHLDYHGTFDNYIKAKKEFFDGLPSNAFALVNADDKHSGIMLQNTKAAKKSFALQSSADFRAKIIENGFNGLFLNIDGKEISIHLIGSFNAYNILLAYSVAILLKEEKVNVLTTLSTLSAVEGRFQYIKAKNGTVGIVDYAHTPDALENVLKTIRDIRDNKQEILTIIGCGGDRDPFKRPIMARIACDLSNRVILTSDNPRSEDPQAIIDEMKKGVPSEKAATTLAITDRREAIKTAFSLAKSGDIVLVAGKGHEKYQEIKGVKHPFDDMDELKELFKTIG